MRHTRTLCLGAAATVLILSTAVIQIGAAEEDKQTAWIDQMIALGVKEQGAAEKARTAAYEQYLSRLGRVKALMINGKDEAVKTELSSLVTFLAGQEHRMSTASLTRLLLQIGQVVPARYLDENARVHLRLLEELEFARKGVELEVPYDAPGGGSAPLTKGAVERLLESLIPDHPLLALGGGILLFVGAGIVVIWFHRIETSMQSHEPHGNQENAQVRKVA